MLICPVDDRVQRYVSIQTLAPLSVITLCLGGCISLGLSACGTTSAKRASTPAVEMTMENFKWRSIGSKDGPFQTDALTLQTGKRFTIAKLFPTRGKKAEFYISLQNSNGERCAGKIENSSLTLISRKQPDSPIQEQSLRKLCTATRIEFDASKLGSIEVELQLDAGLEASLYRFDRFDPNKGETVLFISLDTHAAALMTLEEDSQSYDTNPFLRGEAQRNQDAYLFSGAIAASFWTLPSHATMFTGLYPLQHGLVNKDTKAALSEQVQTLHQLASSKGYATFHLISHSRISKDYGYDRGVDFYKIYKDPLGKRGRKLLGDAEQLIAANPHRKKFFFIHIFDAHSPYDNFPKGYQKEYQGPKPKDRNLYRRKQYIAMQKKGAWHPDDRATNLQTFGTEYLPHSASTIGAYKLGLRDVDNILKSFFTRLKQKGVYEDIAVVLTSDHGEEFFEHATLTHNSLYQQTINVPFWLKLSASGKGKRNVEQLIPYRFEAHTTAYNVLLDLMRIKRPTTVKNDGLGLTELLGLDRNHPAYSLMKKNDYLGYSWINEQSSKIIVSHRLVNEEKQDQAIELYDVDKDPKESNNRYIEKDRALFEQASKVHAKNSDNAFATGHEVELSEDEKERLRALGYVH